MFILHKYHPICKVFRCLIRLPRGICPLVYWWTFLITHWWKFVFCFYFHYSYFFARSSFGCHASLRWRLPATHPTNNYPSSWLLQHNRLADITYTHTQINDYTCDWTTIKLVESICRTALCIISSMIVMTMMMMSDGDICHMIVLN